MNTFYAYFHVCKRSLKHLALLPLTAVYIAYIDSCLQAVCTLSTRIARAYALYVLSYYMYIARTIRIRTVRIVYIIHIVHMYTVRPYVSTPMQDLNLARHLYIVNAM